MKLCAQLIRHTTYGELLGDSNAAVHLHQIITKKQTAVPRQTPALPSVLCVVLDDAACDARASLFRATQ